MARRLWRPRRGELRAFPSRRRGGDRRPGGEADLLFHGRAARRPRATGRYAGAALARSAGQGLLLQLRRRSQRESAQPRATEDRAHHGRHHARRLARPHRGDARVHRRRALRSGCPARRRAAVAQGPVQRCRRARARDGRHRRGRAARAGAGIQRRSHCHAGVPAGGARALRPARREAALRRSAVRRRAHRALHRRRAVRRGTRRHRDGEGAGGWSADRRGDRRPVARRRHHDRRSRLHLRRRPSPVRGGAGEHRA